MKVGLIVAPVATGAGVASTLNGVVPKVVVKFSTACTLFNASFPRFFTIIVNGILNVPFACCTGVPAAFATPILGKLIGVASSSFGSFGLPFPVEVPPPLSGSVPLSEISVVGTPLIAPVPVPVTEFVNAPVKPFRLTFTVNPIVAVAPIANDWVVPTRFVFAPVPVKPTFAVIPVPTNVAGTIVNVTGAGNVVARFSTTCTLFIISVPKFFTVIVNGIL